MADWLDKELSARTMNMDFGEVKQSILIRVSSHHHRLILLSLDNICARSKNFSRVTNVFCP